jgi:hypothetical protein
MKKKTTFHFVAALLPLLLLSFSACQKDSEIVNLAKDDTSITATNQIELTSRAAPRPFKGTTNTWLADEGDVVCNCVGIFMGYGGGAGTITHMGNTTEELSVCIEEIVFDENGEFVEARMAGICIELTAANGDKVFLEGGPHVFGPAPDCFCNTATLTATITGGTGRFDGASGQVDVFVTVNLATGIYTEEYDGWILF